MLIPIIAVVTITASVLIGDYINRKVRERQLRRYMDEMFKNLRRK